MLAAERFSLGIVQSNVDGSYVVWKVKAVGTIDHSGVFIWTTYLPCVPNLICFLVSGDGISSCQYLELVYFIYEWSKTIHQPSLCVPSFSKQ